MKPIKPIYWHQGLFLQPQHFQHQELYIKSDFNHLNSSLTPFPWGGIEYDINRDSLKNNIVEFNYAKFIFQDGTIVSFPENSILPPRAIDPMMVEQSKPVRVFVALKKLSISQNNVFLNDEKQDSLNLQNQSSRFIAETDSDDVKDLYSDTPEIKMGRMNYLIKIFFDYELENIHDYSYFPVALIEREGEETYYASDFIPPIVHVAGSIKLKKMNENITRQLYSRCSQLEEYKNPSSSSRPYFSNEYALYLFALMTLNRYLPLLDSYMKFDNLHPFSLYTIITQLIGELSSFSPRINVFGETKNKNRLLPQYDHENIYYCFFEAGKLISELLDSIIIGPEHIIPLEREESFFSCDIPARAFNPENNFYLIIKTSEDKKNILTSIKNITKLSSLNNIKILVERALPGVPMVHEQNPPPGLPVRQDSNFFKIDIFSPIFEYIKKEKTACFYFEGAPDDISCEIIVLKGER